MTTIKVNIDSTDHYLELYENDPINLMLQYSDIEKIQSAVGSFSQTFRIPATEVNFAAFGDFTNSNNIGFNAKRKSSAIIMKDTLPLIYGVIQLKQTYIVDGKHSEYEIVFFGEAVNLARTLGDKKLADLDLSTYDHTISYANIVLSWMGALFSGDVRYSLIDKQNYSQEGNGIAITYDNPLYAANFTPCLRLEQVVKSIFEDNGLLYESTFIDGLDNYYIPFYNGTEYINLDIPTDNLLFAVGLTATQNITTIGINQVHIVTSLSETTPFYDDEGLVASDTFTAPYSGYYHLECNVKITQTSGLGINSVRVGAKKVGGAWMTLSSEEFVANGQTIYFSMLGNYSPPFYLDAGDQVQLGVLYTMQQSGTLQLQYSSAIDQEGTWMRLIQALPDLWGGTCDLSVNAPDIKQIDFLTSLQKMFNLVFIPDPLIDGKYTIQTFEDFASGGAIKDWSSYLDESKDIIIKPTTDIQKKNYEWTYSSDKDFLNALYEENAQRIYGRYLIEDGENDFSTGDLKVQPEFGAFPLMRIDGTNILVHKSIDANGERITDPLCKVVYWGGLQDTTGVWMYNDGTSTPQLLTQYPYFGHYSTPNPAADDIDLNFGGEIPAHPIEANPYDNLFNTYWRNYVNQLYSVEARMMEAHFWLTSREIHDFEFSDQIWIKDSYWRVLKIQYSATEKALSKVTLIKILDDVRACDEIPYQSNANGVITFQNADGTTTTTPSQECCERFGYVYIGTTCYQPGYEPQGTPITNPYDSSTPALQGSNPEGNVFANGSNVVAPVGTNGAIFGDDVTIDQLARNTLVHGDTIEVYGAKNIFAGGSNTNAFVEGSHRGGGWWYPDFRSGSLGAAQSGEVIFIFEGTFDSGHTRELFIEGKLNNRLSIPNNTGMSVRFEMQLVTISAATGRPNIVHNAIFLECFKKSNNVATGFYGAHANAAIHEVGGMGNNKIHMDVDVTTDTTQHRIQMHNQSFSNRETTRIVCKMSYVMGSL